MVIFKNGHGHFQKRPWSFSETAVVIFRNGHGHFQKRPWSFSKTAMVILTSGAYSLPES
jgi:hypothetical protein